MIADPALRWIVTLLFLFSAGVCVQTILASRHSTASVISHSLHAVMALAMAVMAWPRGAELPTRAPMIFFFAAAVWFAVVMLRSDGHRLASSYHGLMMLAMSWMYAAMGGLPLPAAASGESASMPGMDMGMDMGPSAGGHAGHGAHGERPGAGTEAAEAMSIPVLLNWVCVVFFALASAYWLYRFVTARVQAGDSAGSSHDSLGILCQLAMAAGMAIMFAVMV